MSAAAYPVERAVERAVDGDDDLPPDVWIEYLRLGNDIELVTEGPSRDNYVIHGGTRESTVTRNATAPSTHETNSRYIRSLVETYDVRIEVGEYNHD